MSWAKLDPFAPTTTWDALILVDLTTWDNETTVWDLQLVFPDNWAKQEPDNV